MAGFDVVGVGIACLDFNMTVTKVPALDENVLGMDYRKQMGGPVSTALATLQRLGMSTRYLGALGDDDNGRFVIEQMEAEGIDMSLVRLREDESTGFSFVMVDSMTRKRSIVFCSGGTFTAPADCVDPETIESSSLIHVDIYTPAVVRACEIAREAGVPISIEANVAYPGIEDLLAGGNLFITGKEVACELANEQDPAKAGEKLMDKYNLNLAVVTVAAEGSIAVTEEETASVGGFEIEVVDTTGAGDVFHGAYLYGHLMGWRPVRTLSFANAVGAIMCTGQNGWADIPKVSQVDGFLRERGIIFETDSGE